MCNDGVALSSSVVSAIRWIECNDWGGPVVVIVIR